jgi:hypothetical protein
VIETSKAESNVLEPVTVIPAMVYSFGVFELKMASKSGSTDTGPVVSGITWAERWLQVIVRKQSSMVKKAFPFSY